MTIDEAIKRLDDLSTAYPSRIDPYEYDAIKLSSEALKGLQALRRGKGHPLAELLPGETK